MTALAAVLALFMSAVGAAPVEDDPMTAAMLALAAGAIRAEGCPDVRADYRHGSVVAFGCDRQAYFTRDDRGAWSFTIEGT